MSSTTYTVNTKVVRGTLATHRPAMGAIGGATSQERMNSPLELLEVRFADCEARSARQAAGRTDGGPATSAEGFAWLERRIPFAR